MQRSQQFSAFSLLPEEPGLMQRTEQFLEKLRPIPLAENCRFLTIQSLEFQEIWQKIVQKPRK